MYNPLTIFIKFSVKALILICLAMQLVSCTSDKKIKQEKVEIAILMPLSGPHAQQGQKLAALIKFGIEDKLDGFITTTTYDIATEDFSRQAAEKIVANDTKLILGPLFTTSVKSLENIVKNHQITMITLSNNPTLADPKNIYVFGHAPLKQYHRMITYLLANGHTEFALLMPKTPTSSHLSSVLKEIITASGGNVFLEEQYAQSEDAIGLSIEKLTTSIDHNLDDVHKDTLPIIFIAEDNSENIKTIFDNLKLYPLKDKAVIAGDNRLDVYYEGDVKFLFTGSNRVASDNFAQQVRKTLGISHLNYLENAAYDLGAFTALAIGKNFSRETFTNRLESPVWIDGLSGSFRFVSGVLDRRYDIIERDGMHYKRLHGYTK